MASATPIPKGLIWLSAIVQPIKDKAWLVMDYRELNQYVDLFIVNVNVCTAKLREWKQPGVNKALLDMQRVCLQIRVHELLWPFQIVLVKGTEYCLWHLGFDLNVVPSNNESYR